MMKRCVAYALLVAQLACAAPVWAQDAPAADAVKATALTKTEQLSKRGAVPLKKGAAAPEDGVFLPPPVSAKIIAELKSIDERVTIEVERATGTAAAQCDYKVKTAAVEREADKRVCAAQLDDSKRQRDSLVKQVEEQARRVDPLVWLGLGFVGGMVVSFLSVYAAAQAVK